MKKTRKIKPALFLKEEVKIEHQNRQKQEKLSQGKKKGVGKKQAKNNNNK